MLFVFKLIFMRFSTPSLELKLMNFKHRSSKVYHKIQYSRDL